VIRHRIRRDSHRINITHALKLLVLEESAERPCCARVGDGATVQLSREKKKKPDTEAAGSRARDAIHHGQVVKRLSAVSSISAAFV
jgi:hypothetical protein